MIHHLPPVPQNKILATDAAMDIKEREDKIINPLNSILFLALQAGILEDIEKEVDRIVLVLEQEGIINKRKRGKLDAGTKS